MNELNRTGDANNNINIQKEGEQSQLHTEVDSLTQQVAAPLFEQSQETGAPPPSLTERITLPPRAQRKITQDQLGQITTYVNNHPELFAVKDQLAYVEKGEGLPRSILVKTTGDETKLYVLFKSKLADNSKVTSSLFGATKQKKDIGLIQGDQFTFKAGLSPIAKQLTDKQKAKLDREIQFLTLCKGVPHVVQLEENYEMEGRPQLIETDYSGGELAKQVSKLSTEERYVVIGDIIEGLEGVHSKGIRHADIKPQNILLEEKRAFISDFDQANSVKEPARFAGTAAYISPDLYQAFLSNDKELYKVMKFENDDFAFGVMMGQILDGNCKNPWTAKPASICLMCMTGKTTPEKLQDAQIVELKNRKIISGDDRSEWPKQIYDYFEENEVADLYQEYYDAYLQGQVKPITQEQSLANDLMEPDWGLRTTTDQVQKKWDKIHPRPKLATD